MRRRDSRVSGAAILACGLVFACGQGVALGQIQFRTNPDAARIVMGQKQVLTQLRSLASREDASRVVVQFSAPILPEQRERLRKAGIHLLSPLGRDAYFATLDGDALRPMAAMQAAKIDSVRAIRSEWKLDPLLQNGEIPAWTIVDNADPQDPIVGVYVVYHRDVGHDEASRVTAAHGGQVRTQLRSINAQVVEMPFSRIADLADADEVQWIEAALPQLSELNDSNRAITQVDQVQAAPYNLSGAGVTALVYDAGSVRNSHVDFGGRVTDIDGTGNSTHPTHVAATVGGDGSASGGTFRGMAPGVDILSAGFEWTGGGVFLYENPGDIEDDYGLAISMGADVANNSIGSNTEPNGFDCSIQGNYGVTAAVIDEIARGSLGGPIIIFWSAGNERQGSRCDVEGFGDYYSSAPPANAKNHITIGALNSNNDSMTSFSSWGPADDGRMKPDMCGPGCQSNGDFGVTSASNSNNGYTTLCGTSMSGPTATGIGALILEDFRNQFPGLPDPLNSTMKAILAQTAVDRGNTGPDYQFGYGSIRAKDAIDFMRTGQFTEQTMTQGAVHTFPIDVQAGTSELKFTLAWADPAGTPNVDPALVNDLDIRAIDPNGGIHHPWTLDPLNPSAPAVRTGPNTRDNIEQVFVENPQPGQWVIEVIGTSVPEGPQVYSLVGSPDLNVEIVSISLSSALPPLVDPGVPLTVEAQVTAINDTIVPGSAMLHYRFDGGAYTDVQLTDQGGGVFTGEIPGTGCASMPEFYLSVEGVSSGVVTDPFDGPNNPYAYNIGTITFAMDDNFETDQGWTAENLGASSGFWERGVPVNDPGWEYDPATDGDGSGQCYLTQNQAGNTDVDGGAVRLTSPQFDMSGTGPWTIEYDYFLRLTNSNAEDALLVEMSSNDGATWTVIRDHRTDNGLNWTHEIITQADLDGAGIVPSAQMRIRFTANDSDPQSINESGVDGFRVWTMTCDDGGGCPADLDGDGDADADDFFAYLDLFAAGDPDADIDGDGDADADDFFAYLDLFAAGC